MIAFEDLTAAMEVVAARTSRSRPAIGLVTLVGTMTRAAGDDPPVTAFRARFTGMFGRRDPVA